MNQSREMDHFQPSPVAPSSHYNSPVYQYSSELNDQRQKTYQSDSQQSYYYGGEQQPEPRVPGANDDYYYYYYDDDDGGADPKSPGVPKQWDHDHSRVPAQSLEEQRIRDIRRNDAIFR